MLSLAITVPLKRRTLKERLHLCKKEKIIKESFDTSFGAIDLYSIYHFTKQPYFTPERLKKALKQQLYLKNSAVPQEYLKAAVILRLINRLKAEPKKTVFLKRDFIDTPYLGELCRYSARVYIMSDCLPESAESIYKKYGTMPICTSAFVAADYCPDTKEVFEITLPPELKDICPKEFSPLLFAGLLYKENNVLII